MPHASLKVKPGIDQNETPALNETGLSTSNLVRFIPDRNGLGLVQKLGGWVKFFNDTFATPVRALWGWEDTNSQSHLAIGQESDPLTDESVLSVLTNGVQIFITPRSEQTDIAEDFDTTAGSPVVKVTDATTVGLIGFNTVYIETHVSVGGVILFGLYPMVYVSATEYNITAINVLGEPFLASSTVTAGGLVAEFTTVSSQYTVNVELANHGYQVGDTYPCLVATTVGGVTIFGNYTIRTIVDADNFTIFASTVATSSASGFINGGNVRFRYSYGVGAIPIGSGYGVGGYGSGGYGTGPATATLYGDPIDAYDWTLDNWGQILVAVPRNNDIFAPVYLWDPTSGAPIAEAIPTSPAKNMGAFVAMPQRQIVAWGSTFTGIEDPLLIRWCDVNNYNEWVASITNQAGSYRIPKGSKIVGCIQGPQQGLIWTDLGVWAMQYTGAPYVYSFNELGTGCGLIAQKAAASLGGVVYWMSQSQFYMLSGEGVTPLPCPLWDVIFQDIDQNNIDKVRIATNSRFGEVAWYYPTTGNGGEINAYVKYNTLLQAWDYGSLSRSAWLDQSVLGPPIGADPNTGYIYQHETSPDADGQAMLPAVRTGWFAIAEGDQMTYVDQVWPDMKWGYFGGVQNATVNITFYVADYPGQTPKVYGPYPVTQATQYISPRFRGRLMSIQLSSNDVGSFWRIGNIRYRIKPDGKF